MYTGFCIALFFLDLALLHVILSTDWKDLAKDLSNYDRSFNRYIAGGISTHIGQYNYQSIQRLSVKNNYGALAADSKNGSFVGGGYTQTVAGST